MLRQDTFPLLDQISRANELMRESKESTSDSKNMLEALQIFQTSMEDPGYAKLGYSMRLALSMQLEALIKLLPDKRDDVLKVMIKQAMAEIRHFAESADNDKLVHKVISIIRSEKDQTYLVSMYEQYDAQHKCAESRPAITKEMLKLRLTHLKDLYRSEGEKPDPTSLYENIFQLYPSFLNQDEFLQILVDNLKELINSPKCHKEILDFLEKVLTGKRGSIRFRGGFPFLNFFINEPDYCIKMINEKVLSEDQLEHITKHSKNASILFHVHQMWLTHESCKSEWRIKRKIASIEACAQQAAELKQPFDLRVYLPDFKTYAQNYPNVANYLKAADLGDTESRVHAADLLQKTDLNRALDYYLLAAQEILQTKDTQRVASVIKSIATFKENHTATLSPEAHTKIDGTILNAFKESDFFYERGFIYWLREIINTLSFEKADQILTELNKKYGQLADFLQFAEYYYSKKLDENEPPSEVASRYTDYQHRHNILKNSTAKIQAEIKKLQENLEKSNTELTTGQQLLQWIRDYVATQELDIRSTPFVTLEDDIIRVVKLNLSVFNPSLDLAALLNTSIKSEKAIQIQKKLIEAIFDKDKPADWHHAWHKVSHYVSPLQCFNYLMFYSIVSTLDADSPFYHFVDTARSRMQMLQQQMKEVLFKQVAANFIDSDHIKKWKESHPVHSLHLSKLLGCPIALAIHVNNETSLFGTSDHLLLACAALLVLAKNRDLIKEVTENYCPQYDSYFDDAWRYYDRDEGLPSNSCSKENMLQALKTALSTAESSLKEKSTNIVFTKYQGLAKCLLGYIDQAIVAPPIANPILFLWEKNATSAIKGEDLSDFIHGLAMMLASPDDLKDKKNFKPSPEQIKLFAALNNFIDAQRPGYSRLIKPDAPPSEEKIQTPTPSAPPLLEVKAKQADEKKEHPATLLSSRAQVDAAVATANYPLPAAWDPQNVAKKSETDEASKSPEISAVPLEQEGQPRKVVLPKEGESNQAPLPAAQEFKPVAKQSEDVKANGPPRAAAALDQEDQPVALDALTKQNQQKSVAAAETVGTKNPSELAVVLDQKNQPAVLVRRVQRRLVATAAAAAASPSDTAMPALAFSSPIPITEAEPGLVNSITGQVEIAESKSGVLSVSATILSKLPTEIAFVLFSNHLLLEYRGDTELHVTNSGVYLDAPASDPTTPAPLTVSVEIGAEKENHFRQVKTSVSASYATVAKLELSFFAQKQELSGKASEDKPLTSLTWVKTCGKTG